MLDTIQNNERKFNPKDILGYTYSGIWRMLTSLSNFKKEKDAGLLDSREFIRIMKEEIDRFFSHLGAMHIRSNPAYFNRLVEEFDDVIEEIEKLGINILLNDPVLQLIARCKESKPGTINTPDSTLVNDLRSPRYEIPFEQ